MADERTISLKETLKGPDLAVVDATGLDLLDSITDEDIICSFELF